MCALWSGYLGIFTSGLPCAVIQTGRLFHELHVRSWTREPVPAASAGAPPSAALTVPAVDSSSFRACRLAAQPFGLMSTNVQTLYRPGYLVSLIAFTGRQSKISVPGNFFISME